MDICPYCNIKLGKKSDEHIIQCQNIHNSKKDTFEVTPSMHAMYKMILKLQKENETLKKKINRLEQKTFKKKEKKTIIEWLMLHGNNIYNETISDFGDIYNNINIAENDLVYLLNAGYTEGYGKIIDNICKKKFYIIAWEQKKQIFCWGNKWKILSVDEISVLISKIQKEIMKLYSSWSQKQILNVNFNLNMNNILGGEIKERQKKNKAIYLHIWKNIKKDFHRETEYQILF